MGAVTPTKLPTDNSPVKNPEFLTGFIIIGIQTY